MIETEDPQTQEENKTETEENESKKEIENDNLLECQIIFEPTISWKATIIDVDGTRLSINNISDDIICSLRNQYPDLKEFIKKGSSDYDNKSQNTMQKIFDVIKRFIKKFWALFVGFSVIVTVFGWSNIFRFFRFIFSFFQKITK